MGGCTVLTEHLDRIRAHLKPEGDLKRAFSQIWPRITQSCRDALTREAERYFNLPIPVWTATEMLRGAPNYHQSYAMRRQMLAAFVMCACVHDTDRYDARIFDLVWAICEESSWALCGGESLPVRENPYTREAAETAALLSWANCLAYKAIWRMSSSLDGRIRREITRRVSDPVSKNMEFPTSDPAVLSPLLVAVLLSEQDSPRRWGAVRRLAYWMEEGIGRLYSPSIDIWQEAGGHFMDALTILYFATGNEIDLRRMLRSFSTMPLIANLSGNWWVNPGERSMQSAPSGAALYRFGRGTGNDQLRALGAKLFRMEAPLSHPENMTGRVLSAMYEADIDRESLRPGSLPSGSPAGSSLAVARVERFTAAIHAGDPSSIHCDAGDLSLFFRGRPVFFDLGSGHHSTGAHNLPSIDSQGQLPGGKIAFLESQIRHDAHYLSADIAESYPDRLGLETWQRTVMLPFDRCEVRIIEMFGFAREKHNIEFHFITPEMPSLEETYAVIGELVLEWERGLVPSVENLGSAWRINLSIDRPVRSGNATFIIRPVEN